MLSSRCAPDDSVARGIAALEWLVTTAGRNVEWPIPLALAASSEGPIAVLDRVKVSTDIDLGE